MWSQVKLVPRVGGSCRLFRLDVCLTERTKSSLLFCLQDATGLIESVSLAEGRISHCMYVAITVLFIARIVEPIITKSIHKPSGNIGSKEIRQSCHCAPKSRAVCVCSSISTRQQVGGRQLSPCKDDPSDDHGRLYILLAQPSLPVASQCTAGMLDQGHWP